MLNAGILTVVFSIVLSLNAWAETLNLTTYYPAPTGYYQTISTTRNVGIGTSTGGSVLSVLGGASFGSLATTAAPAGGIITSGNVGIGSASPGSALDVHGNVFIDGNTFTQGSVEIGTSASDSTLVVNGGVSIGTTSNHSTVVLSVFGGNVGIGSWIPGNKLDVTGSVYVNGPLSVEDDIEANGFLYPSDERLKKNIHPISNAIAKVTKLKGVTFQWKKNDKQDLGIIAQNVESVLPELVETDKHGMKSVKYGNLIGLLIEAIKEQQTQINELRKEIKLIRKSASPNKAQ